MRRRRMRVSGSSPLARGLLRIRIKEPIVIRIIPARAGFTILGVTSPPLTWDHPRSRGVYVSAQSRRAHDEGSSPLARGLPSCTGGAITHAWIIPARAGFTSSPATRTRRSKDHPRSRGVYLDMGSDYVTRDGSSPLARGLPLRAAAVGDYEGIIPARAGFTPPASPPFRDR